MGSEEGREELLDVFHKQYDTIVEMLKMVDNPPNCYVLAIQTMCCVEFYRLNEHKLPEFRILEQGDVKTKTKDCAYPLVILLRNLIESETAKVGLWGKFLQALGLKENLEEYRKEIHSKIKIPQLCEKL